MTDRTSASRRADGAQATAQTRVRGSIPLGRPRGVEVDAHWSVLLTVWLFASGLAVATLPEAHPGDTGAAYWWVALGTAAAFLLSLLAHELAHALVARAHGMEVRRITLWMLGGVTELGGPTPTARVDALVALAGPFASLGLGLCAALLAVTVGSGTLLGSALAWLASANVLLAVFNLLPGAPLDGGRVLRAVLWWRYQDRDRAAVTAARAGRVLGYLFVAVGVLGSVSSLGAGLWLMLVGWFIVSGARAEQAAAGDERLAGLTAAEVMSPVSITAPAWWTVEQFVTHLAVPLVTTELFPVVDMDGGTVGVVTLRDLESVHPVHRSDLRLATLAGRRDSPVTVAASVDAGEVAAQIRQHGGIILVEEDGRPVGVVSALELSRATRLSGLGWRVAPHR